MNSYNICQNYARIDRGVFRTLSNTYDEAFMRKYTLFYKQHFYKQRQAEIGKKLSKI